MALARSARGRALLGLLPFLAACQSGDVPASAHAASDAPRDARRGTNAPAAAVAPPVAKAADTVAAAEPAHAANPSSTIPFKGNIEWHTWEDGRRLASSTSKPLFVLVYADWCPHCRALGPVFGDPEVEALAKHFVMVRQNHDDEPSWLVPYNQKYGGYVPRIFFFDADGKFREDLTSGHPRYPFFYAAEQPGFLKRTMQRAIGS